MNPSSTVIASVVIIAGTSLIRQVSENKWKDDTLGRTIVFGFLLAISLLLLALVAPDIAQTLALLGLVGAFIVNGPAVFKLMGAFNRI